MASPSAAVPDEVVASARAAGLSGELLATAPAAARARLSTRALLARHRRAVEAGRPAPAAFPDPQRRADGRPVVLWFPVEHLDLLAAERASGPQVALGAAAEPGELLASSEVVHAFELEVERLRGEVATQQALTAAAEGRAEVLAAEVLRLRAALVALATTTA